MLECKRYVTEVVSLAQRAENVSSVPSPLKGKYGKGLMCPNT